MPTDNSGAGIWSPSATTATPTNATQIPVFPGSSQQDFYSLGALPNIFVGTSTATKKFGGMASQDTTQSTSNQYSSAQAILNQLTQLSVTNPSAFANVQAEMYNAGMYSGKPTYGTWTAKDGDALGEALRGYLAVSTTNPIAFTEWLSGAAKVGAADGAADATGGSTKAPLQLTSSGTLDQYGNTEAQSELGRNLDPAEQAAFVNKYHGEETAAYNGSTEAAGDPTAEAKQFVDTTDNAESQTHMQADYAERMLSMLGVQSS